MLVIEVAVYAEVFAVVIMEVQALVPLMLSAKD